MSEIEMRIKVLVKLKAAIRIVQFIINRCVSGRMIILRLWNGAWRLYALGNTTINLQSTAIEVTSTMWKYILIVETHAYTSRSASTNSSIQY